MKYFWLILGLFLAAGAVFAFNALPEGWFCDYGEAVPEKRLRRLSPARALPLFCGAAALAWLAGERLLSGAALPLFLLLTVLCSLVAAADFIYRIIPDQFSAAIALAGAGFAAADWPHFWLYLAGAAAFGGAVFAIGLAGRLFSGGEAMGFGDVKLAAALGLACGVPGFAFALAIALILGAARALPKLISRSEDRHIPFGPFLCAGALASILFAAPLRAAVSWYISLF